MTDLVRQAGGVVLDEIYVPLTPQPAEIAKAVQKIARAQPDVVFSTVVGRGTAMLYEAFVQAGLDSSVMPIASLTTSEAEVAEMSPAAARGHITAAPFFDVLTTPAAAAFVSAYRLRFGSDAPVPAAAEAAYFQVLLAAEAIARAGTDEPERVHAALPDCETEAPQGRVRIDHANNHTFLWPRVGRLDEHGAFEIVWSAAHRVKPDPYRVTQTLDDWSGNVAFQAYG